MIYLNLDDGGSDEVMEEEGSHMRHHDHMRLHESGFRCYNAQVKLACCILQNGCGNTSKGPGRYVSHSGSWHRACCAGGQPMGTAYPGALRCCRSYLLTDERTWVVNAQTKFGVDRSPMVVSYIHM